MAREYGRKSGSYSTAVIGRWELVRQDISGNYSVIRSSLAFYYGGGQSVGSEESSFGTMGVTLYSGFYRFYPGETDLGYTDFTVYHNNDGTFPETDIGFWASSFHISSGEVWGKIYSSDIPTIPRQANVTNATNFTDEGNPTITYTNPGGFRINARLEFANMSGIIRRDNISNTGSYTFDLTSAERDLLRQKCTGNSMTVREVIATCIGGTTENYWSWQDKTMTMVNANPTFSNFTFEDINSTTLALTGNNQDIIKGYSNVQVNISSENKATAIKQATMKSYRFASGDKSTTINYSSTENVSGSIIGVPNGTFNVYAIDSRNNSTLVTKLAHNEIDYLPLTKGNISIARTNGVSEQSILKFDGTINIIDFGEVNNSIKVCKYRYKTGLNEWSNYIDITPTVSNEEFTFEDLIEGDTEEGFDISNTYNIEVYVEDELSNVTFTTTLGSGIPNIAIHKNGVGIMGKYDTTVGGNLQVGGKRLEPNLISEYVCDGSESEIVFNNINLKNDGCVYELYLVGKTNESCLILTKMNNTAENHHYTNRRIYCAGAEVIGQLDNTQQGRQKTIGRGDVQGFSVKCDFILDEVSQHVNWLSMSYTVNSTASTINVIGGYYNTANPGDYSNNLTKLVIEAYETSTQVQRKFSAGTICKLYKKV